MSKDNIEDDEVVPKWKRPRVELPPDVDPSLTSIPFVLERILLNNKETKPKHRLTHFDILNESFVAAVKRMPADDELVFQILEESRTQHGMAPRSGSLSQALFIAHKARRTAFGIRLIQWIMSLQQSLPQFFRTSFDEKVVAVATRIVVLHEVPEVRIELILSMLKALPADQLRRRVFTPIFEGHCAVTGDVVLMRQMLRFGLDNELEFWDEDFHSMLRSCATATMDQEGAKKALDEVLKAMVAYHPVVGSANADVIAQLLPGSVRTTVNPQGECANCHEALHQFDFTDEERTQFQNDVLQKLMLPRTTMESHYEKGTPVTKEVQAQREAEITAFFSRLETSDFDAVIDGANVGYYGLSSWYRDAKIAQLKAQGVDADAVAAEVGVDAVVPFPVDVPPKFGIIDDMMEKVRRLGRKPVVMLHERHVSAKRAVGDNALILQKWKAEQSIIPTPFFLNDDYCWLAAAVGKRGCVVVTNDLMRDHHFLMLSQRPFLRWRQRYRITYRAFVQVGGTVSVSVRLPRPYSVWVQQSHISHRWHIPFSSKNLIEQATNKVRVGDEALQPLEALEKDGTDTCDGWLCTGPLLLG